MDEVSLGGILDVPTAGLKTVEGIGSPDFKKLIIKKQAVQTGERVHKNALHPEYQLLFELVNKVLLPRAERRSITSITDLVLLEVLDSYSSISLLGIMIEYMLKVADFKDGNHGLPYEFLLTKVLEYFEIPLGKPLWGQEIKCSI